MTCSETGHRGDVTSDITEPKTEYNKLLKEFNKLHAELKYMRNNIKRLKYFENIDLNAPVAGGVSHIDFDHAVPDYTGPYYEASYEQLTNGDMIIMGECVNNLGGPCQ